MCPNGLVTCSVGYNFSLSYADTRAQNGPFREDLLARAVLKWILGILGFRQSFRARVELRILAIIIEAASWDASGGRGGCRRLG